MEPPDPLVQTGSTLILNCTLTNHSLPYNASHIRFKHGGRLIAADYVTVKSTWTAELRLPNVTRNISGHHFFCDLPIPDTHIGQQVITVAGKYTP